MERPQILDDLSITDKDAPPPILGSWQNLYWFVLLLHAFLLTLFYWVTNYFS